MNLKKIPSDFSSAKSQNLSTNYSQRSCFVGSEEQGLTTPSFMAHNKQTRFLKVTGKVIRELKFGEDAP